MLRFEAVCCVAHAQQYFGCGLFVCLSYIDIPARPPVLSMTRRVCFGCWAPLRYDIIRWPAQLKPCSTGLFAATGGIGPAA